MSNPLRDLFFGGGGFSSGSQAADVIEPQRTFADVVLPEETRRQLDRALTQVRKRRLIGRDWGLAERHPTGLGLAFNFAGPPGTGKTLCAEALADALDRNLMLVRYDEMQSMWMGATGKNIASVFDAARSEEAVLFFDEADAIAGRRSGSVGGGGGQGYEREANAIVNVLLRELEEHDGVVIFATNLAANLDPAFERRIRTHVAFEMPSEEARRKIWQVQLHRKKTPLAGDVDFEALAERFEASGGDIKNAVLNAAQAAAAEPGPDQKKKIAQRHFIQGMEAVQAGKEVMNQSLFRPEGDGAAGNTPLPGGGNGPRAALAQHLEGVGQQQQALVDRQETLTDRLASLDEEQDRQGDQLVTVERALELLTEQVEKTGETQSALSDRFDQLEQERDERREWRLLVQVGVIAALVTALTALALTLFLVA